MSWEIYYKKLYKKPPSPLIKIALEHNKFKNGRAYDLGCGTGSDTRYLLQKKWSVVAVDREVMAIAILKRDLKKFDRLKCIQKDFNNLTLRKTELIHGTYSFGFAGEEGFFSLWEKMVSALKSGGTISGELFGDKDDWHKTPRVKTLTQDEFGFLINGFDLVYFDEEVFEMPTALGNNKKWHVYSFVIRKI